MSFNFPSHCIQIFTKYVCRIFADMRMNIKTNNAWKPCEEYFDCEIMSHFTHTHTHICRSVRQEVCQIFCVTSKYMLRTLTLFTALQRRWAYSQCDPNADLVVLSGINTHSLTYTCERQLCANQICSYDLWLAGEFSFFSVYPYFGEILMHHS